MAFGSKNKVIGQHLLHNYCYGSALNRSTLRWYTLGSVRCAHGYVALALFVRLAHATQGWPEIRVYESLVG